MSEVKPRTIFTLFTTTSEILMYDLLTNSCRIFKEDRTMAHSHTVDTLSELGGDAHPMVKLSDYDELIRQNKILRSALEFYADTTQMNHGISLDEYGGVGYINEDDFECITVEREKEPVGGIRRAMIQCYGHKAREALKSCGSGGDNHG